VLLIDFIVFCKYHHFRFFHKNGGFMKKDLITFAASLIIFGLSAYYFYNYTLGKNVLREFGEITETVNNKSAIKIFYPLEYFSAAIPDIDLQKHKAIFIKENSTFPTIQMFEKNSAIFLIYPDKYQQHIENAGFLQSHQKNIKTMHNYKIVEIETEK